MNYITVEYSASQGQFHISTMDDVLNMNRYNALHRNSNDYQLLALFEVDNPDDDFDKFQAAQAFVKNFDRLQRERNDSWL